MQSLVKAVMEAGADLTLKVGPSFVRLNASGVTVSGPKVRINSGGSPGSGSGAAPLVPAGALMPDFEACVPSDREAGQQGGAMSAGQETGMPFCAVCACLEGR